MTYIRSFKIWDLAGRGLPVSHDLDRFTNVFWGLNGSGKTTVLEILNGAFKNQALPLLTLPFSRAEVIFHSDVIDRDVERTLDKEGIGRPDRPSGSKRRAPVTGRLVSSNIEWSVDESDRDEDDPGWQTTIQGEKMGADDEPYFLRTSYADTFLSISRVSHPAGQRAPRAGVTSPAASFARRVNEVWQSYSATSLADIDMVQQQGLASVLAILFGGRGAVPDASEQIFRDTPDIGAQNAFELVSSFLMTQGLYLPLGRSNVIDRYDRSVENRQVVSRIQDTNRVVDLIRAPQREVQAVLDSMYIGGKHVELQTGQTTRRFGAQSPSIEGPSVSVTIGSRKIPLGSLSSGEKQLLQILLETLAASNSTVLIDEPELSLHPGWQRTLVASMRRVNNEAQFILATHSPELMIDVDDDQVFEL